MDRAPRYDIQQRVSLRRGSGAEFSAQTQNISETGVLVWSPQRASRGDRLEIQFPTFSAPVEVIWVREMDKLMILGLKFLDMSRKDRKALDQLLDLPEGALAEG